MIQKNSKIGYLAWIIGCLFYLYESSLNTILTHMMDPLVRDLAIDSVQFGVLSSIFLIAYSSLQLPAGIILDHISIKKVMIGAVATCSLGCLLFASSNSYQLILCARFIMGIGSAFAVLSTFKIISVWFDTRHFMTLTGLMCTFGTLGHAFGMAAVHLLDIMSWQSILYLWSALGFGILAIVIMGLKTPLAQEDENISPLTCSQVIDDLLHIIRYPQVWLILFFGLLIYAPYLTLTNSWAGKFLENTLSIGTAASASIAMTVPYGFAIGAPLLSYISDKQGKRKPMLIFSTLGTAIILILTTGPFFTSVIVYKALFFSLGFSISGFLPSFSVIKEITPTRTTATSLGLMNTFNSLGGAILSPVVGKIIQNNIAHGLARPYASALYILPACVLIALIFALASRETNCTQVK